MKRLMCGLLLGMLCLPLGGCRGEEMERFFITTAMAIDWEDGQYSLKLEGSADEILSSVSSEVRRKLWLNGMPHVCIPTPALPAIADAMDELMQEAAKQ